MMLWILFLLLQCIENETQYHRLTSLLFEHFRRTVKLFEHSDNLHWLLVFRHGFMYITDNERDSRWDWLLQMLANREFVKFSTLQVVLKLPKIIFGCTRQYESLHRNSHTDASRFETQMVIFWTLLMLLTGSETGFLHFIMIRRLNRFANHLFGLSLKLNYNMGCSISQTWRRSRLGLRQLPIGVVQLMTYHDTYRSIFVLAVNWWNCPGNGIQAHFAYFQSMSEDHTCRRTWDLLRCWNLAVRHF